METSVDKKVEIYSKKDCSYCTRIKDLFDFHNIQYSELILGEGHTREEIQERVGNIKKINVVPQLFVNNEYVGGYLEAVEFVAYDKHMNVKNSHRGQ